MQKAGRIAGIGLLVSSFLSLIPSLGPFLDFIVYRRIEVSKLSATNTFVSLIIHLIGLLLLVVGALMLAKATGRKKIASYFVGSAVTDITGMLWVNFFYFSFFDYFVSPLFNNGRLELQISVEPLIVGVILMILYYMFLYKACKELALATNMKIFSEATKLFKWGGILLIVFGVGAIGILLGIILCIIGLFTIKQEFPAQEM